MIRTLLNNVQCRWFVVVAVFAGMLHGSAFDFGFNSPLWWLAPLFSSAALMIFVAVAAYAKVARKDILLFAYVFGVGSFGWGLNWVYISMTRFGGAPLSFSIVANIALVLLLSLYWLLAAYLIRKIGTTSGQRLMLAAPIIALCEWLRSVLFIGFPWLSIGYAWVDTPVAKVSAIGGVFFVSFVVIASIALVLSELRWWKKVLIGCVLIILGSGVYNATVVPQKEHTLPSTRVAVIQGNIPVITEYTPSRILQGMKHYQKMTHALLQNYSPDVVIWPESAVPYFYREYYDFFAELQELQQQYDFSFISGVARAEWPQRNFFNSIVMQTKNSSITAPQFYDKHHLLPFGEYLPFRSVFAFFRSIVDIPMAGFTPGAAVQPGFVVNGMSLSLSICFEIVFGDEIRRNARNSNILLNISNDAWFGRSKVQLQHLNIARMRAIENQRMLIRATNDGLTAMVDKDGSVLESLPPYTANMLTVKAQAYDAKTPYMSWGDWLVILLCVVWLVVFIVLRIFHRRGQLQ